MKKLLCITLSLVLLIILCACGKTADLDGTTSNDNTGNLPEILFGPWHPHPEVSVIPIEIYSDGTCVLDGQLLEWHVETITDAQITLLAADYYLTFTQLSSSFPLLSASNYGLSLKDPELWNYMVEWHTPDQDKGFVLDIEELLQTDCNIHLNGNGMTIEVLEGETVTHTIKIIGSQATVTDPEGNHTVYYTADGNVSDGLPNENTNDHQTLYQQALKDLESVITGGYMTDYVTSEGVIHLTSGANAIEKLYHTFLSLQDYVNVSEQLSRIHKVDHVLVKEYHTYGNGQTIPKAISYNGYGQLLGISELQSINSGEYLYFGYDKAGNIAQLDLFGLIAGVPIYSNDGRITALKLTSPDSQQEYIAPLTYDAYGRVIRIDIPYYINYAGSNESDFSHYYEFVYNESGKLVQYSDTYTSTEGTYETTEFYKKHGFFQKDVVEYYYNPNGTLNYKIIHNANEGTLGDSSWWYSISNIYYDNLGNVIKEHEIGGNIFYNIPGTQTPDSEINRMHDVQNWIFHTKEFLNTISNNYEAQIDGHIPEVNSLVLVEYEYGSIYVYQST